MKKIPLLIFFILVLSSFTFAGWVRPIGVSGSSSSNYTFIAPYLYNINDSVYFNSSLLTNGSADGTGGWINTTDTTYTNLKVGIGVTNATSQIHAKTTLNTTSNQVAYNLSYTTNKPTTGDDTGLLIHMTDTNSNGTSLLQEWRVGTLTKALINNFGEFYLGSTVRDSTSTPLISLTKGETAGGYSSILFATMDTSGSTSSGDYGLAFNMYARPGAGLTTTEAYPIFTLIALGAGTTTRAYANNVRFALGGNAGSVAMLASDSYSMTLGNITNLYGVLVPALTKTGGNLTNHYGIYLGNVNKGDVNNYAIYSAGGKSYFNDSVGIGTASPTQKLTVNGNITANGTVYVDKFSVRNDTNNGMDRCTLVGGVCTIANTQITNNTNVFCFEQSNGGTMGSIGISARNSGVNYTISSSNILDTSIVACMLIEPHTG